MIKFDPTTIPTTEEDVLAVQAVLKGVANDGQQKRAMEWIGKSACRLFEPEFEPGEQPLQSAHNSGRRYVGILIGLMGDPRVLEAVRNQSKPTSNRRGKTQ